MSGAKTRFGFAGSGGEPPDEDEPRSARTVMGHDIHLRDSPSSQPAVAPPGTPLPRAPLLPPAGLHPAAVPVPHPRAPAHPGRVMAAVSDERTDQIRQRHPARAPQSRLARFLGRWTTGGHFRSSSHLDGTARLDQGGDSVYRVPRDTTGRNVVLVVVVAALTFFITFAIVRTRHRPATPAMVPEAVGQPPPTTGQATAPPQGQAQATIAPTPPAAPIPSPQVGSTPQEQRPQGARVGGRVPLLGPRAESRPVEASRPRALAPAQLRPASKSQKRPAPFVAEPPAHLKGELLPIR
jgi:hypothetical protein